MIGQGEHDRGNLIGRKAVPANQKAGTRDSE
jgi:hypothetical protein